MDGRMVLCVTNEAGRGRKFGLRAVCGYVRQSYMDLCKWPAKLIVTFVKVS